MPLGNLTDLLLLRMGLPHQEMAELYGEVDVRRRVRRALEEHARRPIPKPDKEG